MSDIATKLTYLNTTKSQLKDMINYGLDDNNKITSSTTFREYVSSIFNAFLEALRTPDTLFTNLPKKSGSGANITLNDTANAPMRIELGSRALEQKTTTGKNLLPASSSLTDSNGISTTANSDGSMTMSGTATKSWAVIGSGYVAVSPIPAGTYTFSMQETATFAIRLDLIYTDDTTQNSFSITAGELYRTITTTKDIKSIRVEIYSGLVIGTAYNQKLYLQLESGSSATPFEKFTYGASPNPSYPQDIHTISGSNKVKVMRNIFDITDMLANALNVVDNGNNSYTFSTSSNMFNNTIPLKSVPNDQITISYKILNGTGKNFRIKFVYEDSYMNDTTGSGTGTSEKSISSTSLALSNHGKVIGLRADYSTAGTFIISDFMVNVGTTSIPFTPYVSQEADIDLKSNNLAFKGWAGDFVSRINNLGHTTIQDIDGKSYLYYQALTGYPDYDTKYLFKINWKANTQYTISFYGKTTNTSGYADLCIEYTDGTYTEFAFANSNTWENISLTSTSGKTIKYLRMYYRSGACYIDINSFMVNEGTTALPYEEYYDYGFVGKMPNTNYENSLIRNSGKNLLPPNIDTQTLNQLTITNNGNGTYTLNGTANANTNFVFNANKYIDFKAGTYMVSCNTYTNITLAGYYGSGTNCFWRTSNGTFTLNDDITNFRLQITIPSGASFNNVTITPMIEKGSTATSYEPYGSNEWYIKKNIGKVVLDGSEAWEQTGETAISSFVMGVGVFDTDLKGNQSVGYSNYFKCKYSNEVGAFYFNNSSVAKAVLCLENTYTLETFKTWLGTHNTEIYYVLKTPTYTKITGTLAEQLENVYQKMLSYSGQTNISQVNNDLSFVINASALEEL